MQANFNLKVGTLNIQGQNRKDTFKLRKIKNLFQKGSFDILLLQETRSDGSDKELKKWCKTFNTKQIYLTNFGSSAVGAGIIIKDDDVFKVNHEIKDPKGRFVGVIGDHEEGRFLVLSFYSPSLEIDIVNFAWCSANTIYIS